MFKNYILIAFRNLKKHKTFSLINIIGMAIGLTGFAIFALTAGVKLNADKFHKNAERIYNVVQVFQSENKAKEHVAFTPMPLLESLKNEFHEVEDGLRVYPVNKIMVKNNKDVFYERNVLFADPNFFTFFSFDMITGTPETALSNPYSIVLSENAAEKYFGESDPVGKVLILDNSVDVTVTGIFRNVNRTSSIRFEFLVSIEAARSLYNLKENWQQHQLSTFLTLQQGSDITHINQKIHGMIQRYYNNSPESPKGIYLFPLLKYRLDSMHIKSFINSSSRIGVVVILGIGIILLLIVSINFINLSIARYMKRINEIGVRKVIGARRSQLIIQFISESVITAFIALPIAIVIYELVEPFFTAYVGKFTGAQHLSNVANSILNYPFLLIYMFGTTLLVGLFSGLYPAFYLSKFQPAKVLKGSLSTGAKKRRGSKFLIVIQFTLSILLIAAASLIKDQFVHLLNVDLGYNRQNVAFLKLSNISRNKIELLKAEISQHPDVVTLSGSAGKPMIWSSKDKVMLKGQAEKEAFKMQTYCVDYNFPDVLDMNIIAGRSFSIQSNDEYGLVLNESAVKRLNLENPIGKQLEIGDRAGAVIGIVEDFLFDDIGFEMPPAVLYMDRAKLNYLIVKHTPSSQYKDIEKFLTDKWKAFFPDQPFECESLDYYINDFLGFFNRIADFFNVIGLTAIFFSCLGLLGLVSYLIEHRIREIGIRKVLGASLVRINWIFLKEFIFLIIIANFIGLILLTFGWKLVLQTGILYMVDISTITYISVILISFITALLAIFSQTIKAALTNPVENLRYE